MRSAHSFCSDLNLHGRAFNCLPGERGSFYLQQVLSTGLAQLGIAVSGDGLTQARQQAWGVAVVQDAASALLSSLSHHL